MNPTKQQCEELIDKLADKTLSFGCRLGYTGGGKTVKYYANIIKEVDWDDGKIRFILYYEDSEDEGFRGSESLKANYKIIGHPVMIGDVLEKTNNKEDHNTIDCTCSECIQRRIGYLWSKCGFTKSLNEILENAEFEEERIFPKGDSMGCSCHINPPCSFCENTRYEEILKDPNIANLFSFLIKIFND